MRTWLRSRRCRQDCGGWRSRSACRSATARRRPGLFDAPGVGSAYLIGLSVLLEILALLTVGLVRPWGETFPDWVPVVARRPIRRRPVTIAAATGAILLTAIWVPTAALWWWSGDGHLDRQAHTLVGLTYVPLAAWGPLLAAVTWSYHQRRVTRRSFG